LEARTGRGRAQACAEKIHPHSCASRCKNIPLPEKSLTRQFSRDKLRPFLNSQRKEAHFMLGCSQKKQEMQFAVRDTNVFSRSAPVC
jgi:hypothetical protein